MNIAVSKSHQFSPPPRPEQTHSRPRLEVVRNVPNAQAGHSLVTKPNHSTAPAILFGPFRLLPARRLLLEGHEPVRIGSRALEILIVLIEHHGELLSKNALMDRVWPDTTVVEANLSVHIAALRRVLRDGSNGNRYLINTPGRGYRFVAPITIAEDRETSPSIDSTTRPLPNPARVLTPSADNLNELTEQLPQWRLLIVAAATLVAEIVKGTPLGVEPARVHQLASAMTAAAPTLSFPAVQLFVERVKASLGEIELNDANPR